MLRIPYITHDSDAMPGLANRIIARWARMHAVALPKDVYAYPADKTVTVGVPISHQYHQLDTKEQQALRKQLALDSFEQVVLVTGGGTGAQNINNAVARSMPELLERYPNLAVVHLTGRGKDSTVRQQYKKTLSAQDQKRVITRDFVTNLHEYSGAADVVVTRAGGTVMAELAAQAKACIVVPNPLLAGGHQLKNARVLADRKAARFVHDDTLAQDHRALMPALTDLLDHPDKAAALGKKLSQLAQPDAARHLAMVLLDTVKNTSS
jgi:UDP-N-acetylglucosamine--N-acetylmuramyl-(pentapeptide) pyrophosphoryl-undecaprenol N-acetylglucosamine transferase